ncbi:MAG: GNAT family N-acetyltransferase [Anaerolineae bacterium]
MLRPYGLPRMITYTDSLASITADHLRGGFFAGWSRTLTPETHLRTLHGADGIVLAIDDATGNVVGYVTMITDGVLSAFIPNIEVLAAYHGQGIGSELMRRMFDRLKAIPNIDLMCDPSVQPFYARFGMQPLGGMAIRKRDIDINE